jgi:hypothetical protein
MHYFPLLPEAFVAVAAAPVTDREEAGRVVQEVLLME